MYGLLWIPILCLDWGNSAMIFTSDFVTLENHRRIASWVIKKKTVFTVTHALFYFSRAFYALMEHITLLNQLSVHFAKDGLYWLDIVTSSQFNLWHHPNTRYWHCDIIFVNCSCMHKLAQRRSSLVNNNCEYWFPTIPYSQLSVQKNMFLSFTRNDFKYLHHPNI